MNNLFLAKSNPKETILEHTEALVREYYRLKAIYPDIYNINWSILKLACIYHDFGKMNTAFQNKIIGNINNNNGEKIDLLENKFNKIEEIPHGYLSCGFLDKEVTKHLTKDEIKVLREAIFYHHNREKLNGERFEELKTVLKEDLQSYLQDFKSKYKKYANYFEDYTFLEVENTNSRYLRTVTSRILNSDDEIKNIDLMKLLIMTKGLLNKIDYAASSHTKVEYDPEDLVYKVEKSINKFGYTLNSLQEYMKENTNNNIVVTASTGIGKTEGALLWIGKNKGFFTLPLKVSINSIYDRVIDETKINNPKSKTALLHSDSASEYLKRDENSEIDKEYLDSTKQLAYPLTICTIDQLIDFIFKFEGFELKLATLSYSKLVIDEIQMYSPRLVAYLIIALRDIVYMGGKFAILTATLPPVFEYFMDYIKLKRGEKYIRPDKPFIKQLNGKSMIRHKIKVHKKNIDIDSILKCYRDNKILVIVNTVKKAQELYDEINRSNFEGEVKLFHSKFIKRDRSIKEKEIFNNGQQNQKFKGIWVTTQVVEASLDIDFDVLFTELSDICGLLQRMGRTYRNRLLKDSNCNINLFVGNSEKFPSGIGGDFSIIDMEAFEHSKRVIIKYDNKELDEETKMKMVDEVYSVDNMKKSKYFNEIKKTIDAFKHIEAYSLRKNEKRLREIESETIIPYKIYEENENRILEIKDKLNSKISYSEKIKLNDELMNFTVNISKGEFEYRVKKGLKYDDFEINEYQIYKKCYFEYSFAKGLDTNNFKTKNDFFYNQII